MLRVEAAIFASAKPVPREALVRVVGEDCRFDDLIADLIHELRGRPYDLVLVAGGYALAHQNPLRPGDPRRPSWTGRRRRGGIDPDGDLCADGDRLFAAGHAGGDFEAGRARDQSRHRRTSKRHGLIDGAIRAPAARRAVRLCDDVEFLEAFGLASLRELPTSNG